MFFKCITFGICALAAVLGAYYLVLSGKVSFIGLPETVSLQSIFIFHACAIFSMLWLIFAILKKIISRAILIACLCLVLVLEGTFLGANINGDIWVSSQVHASNILEYIRSKIK